MAPEQLQGREADARTDLFALGAVVFERIELPFPEWSVAFHLPSGFISICLLTGGLEAIWTANNAPEGDSWEFLN